MTVCHCCQVFHAGLHAAGSASWLIACRRVHICYSSLNCLSGNKTYKLEGRRVD